MAGGPWFRRSRSWGCVPIDGTGWFVTMLLVAVEFAGTVLLIFVPEARHEPIGVSRGLGWFLLSAGNITFFIMLSQARMAPETTDSDTGR